MSLKKKKAERKRVQSRIIKIQSQHYNKTKQKDDTKIIEKYSKIHTIQYIKNTKNTIH